MQKLFTPNEFLKVTHYLFAFLSQLMLAKLINVLSIFMIS